MSATIHSSSLQKLKKSFPPGSGEWVIDWMHRSSWQPERTRDLKLPLLWIGHKMLNSMVDGILQLYIYKSASLSNIVPSSLKLGYGLSLWGKSPEIWNTNTKHHVRSLALSFRQPIQTLTSSEEIWQIRNVRKHSILRIISHQMQHPLRLPLTKAGWFSFSLHRIQPSVY